MTMLKTTNYNPCIPVQVPLQKPVPVSLYIGSFSPIQPEHIATILAALEFSEQLVIIPNQTKPTKPNLAPVQLRIEMIRLLLDALLREEQKRRVHIEVCGRTMEEQQAVSAKYGHQIGKINFVGGHEGLLPYLEMIHSSRDKQVLDLKIFQECHNDIFVRRGEESSVERFKVLANHLNIPYQLHPSAAKTSRSSSEIRIFLRNGGAKAWKQLGDIYPRNALSFLLRHIEAFSK